MPTPSRTSEPKVRRRRTTLARSSRFGSVAQTMSLIEPTSSRARSATSPQAPGVLRASLPLQDLDQDRDAREARADVVVKVGCDAGPDALDSEAPRGARVVERVADAADGERRTGEEPGAAPERREDRERHRRGGQARSP